MSDPWFGHEAKIWSNFRKIIPIEEAILRISGTIMEFANVLSLRSCTWIGLEQNGRKPDGFLRASWRCVKDRVTQSLLLRDWGARPASIGSRHVDLQILRSHKNCEALAFEAENSSTSVEEDLILKEKAQLVFRLLNGKCIYLTGMMGSGKFTVGKILAEALGYFLCDSDKLVEQAVGGTSVAQIFKEHGEDFFRDKESDALEALSNKGWQVVATGGGAVTRPQNWRYMKCGITVWLDVPLEALAKRIADVGTDSRPLLHQESGDAYEKAFMRLTTLFKERSEAYANADARVSLQHVAAKGGCGDVSALTPTAIAIEVLIQIEKVLNDKTTMEIVLWSREDSAGSLGSDQETV